jgi:hypothetical protein
VSSLSDGANLHFLAASFARRAKYELGPGFSSSASMTLPELSVDDHQHRDLDVIAVNRYRSALRERWQLLDTTVGEASAGGRAG